MLQARAKIVEPLFAVRCFDEAILRATAVAHAQDFALAAVARQARPLILAEFPLPRILDHFRQGLFVDIADLVLRLDVMIAGVEVAVMLGPRPSLRTI